MRSFLVVMIVACGGSPKPAAPPPPTGGDDSCEPGRCLDDISRAIGDRRDEARACYDHAHLSQPGKLFMNFQIDAAGKVIETSQGMQDDQISDASVVSCVGDVIKKIKFAKSARGKTTRAYHRFEFTPQH